LLYFNFFIITVLNCYIIRWIFLFYFFLLFFFLLKNVFVTNRLLENFNWYRTLQYIRCKTYILLIYNFIFIMIHLCILNNLLSFNLILHHFLIIQKTIVIKLFILIYNIRYYNFLLITNNILLNFTGIN
jgi:hypothetical protein